MKTMKNLMGPKGMTYVVMAFFMFLASCSDNNKIDYSANDNANVQSEANSDAQTEDTDDMSALAVSADDGTLSGGRPDESFGTPRDISKDKLDDRFKCATVTLTFATDNNTTVVPNVIHGFITINFGTGCTGPGGHIRTGIIKIEFQGRRFLPGSKIITTFQNYTVDGIKLEGTRTLTNTSASETSAVSFSIVEDGMKVTWPDATFATRSSSRTRTWNRTANPTGDSWTVTGSATGTNRKGKEYSMTITKALVYKRACAISNKVFMAVEGTKELTTDNKKVTIDYGSGECDNKVTITINGKSKVVEATSDGN